MGRVGRAVLRHVLLHLPVAQQCRVELSLDGAAVHACPDENNLLAAVAKGGGVVKVGEDHLRVREGWVRGLGEVGGGVGWDARE